LAFLSAFPLSDLYVCVVTLAEIRFGIELNSDPQRRSDLQDWLTSRVRPMFDADRTLPVTEEILLKWRLLLEEGRKRGTLSLNPIC
jgi:predicted nucleic acid-binding protein